MCAEARHRRHHEWLNVALGAVLLINCGSVVLDPREESLEPSHSSGIVSVLEVRIAGRALLPPRTHGAEVRADSVCGVLTPIPELGDPSGNSVSGDLVILVALCSRVVLVVVLSGEVCAARGRNDGRL